MFIRFVAEKKGMNSRLMPLILMCFVLMAGCIGDEPVRNQVEINYEIESESRIYEHNFSAVMGSEMMMMDEWDLNNTSRVVSSLYVGYQQSPMSEGWVNVTLFANDTLLFSENHTDMGSYEYENLTQEPLFHNWTLIIYANGSDYSPIEDGIFQDRFYINMTTTYTNQTN